MTRDRTAPRARRGGLAVSASALVIVLACGGGAAPPTGAGPTPGATAIAPTEQATDVPSSAAPGAELCSLLGAEDFGAFGYVIAAEPSVSSDGPGSAYCVYAGESGATGGIEFDAFVDDTTADAEETFRTIVEGGLTGAEPADLPGADESVIATDIDDTWSAIAVRKGRFSYTVSLPAGDEAETQLKALAAAVLARAGDLAD